MFKRKDITDAYYQVEGGQRICEGCEKKRLLYEVDSKKICYRCIIGSDSAPPCKAGV